jgi:tetratricopeptide (TPR) repeat protein
MKKKLLSTILVFGVIVMTFALFSNRKKTTNYHETTNIDTSIAVPLSPSTFPALLVKKNDGDTVSVPLHISALKMDIKVIGNIATNTMELTFYNDLERILEGEFCFPLGEGQTVSDFGIETDGVMRDGVIVEKTKGRVVFESTVRKNIDPGLLEWTKGNNFKTRIYPIPSKGTKKIRISFTQELISGKNSFVYLQPMLFKDAIDEFSLRTEVLQQTVKPNSVENNLFFLEFESWDQSWIAEKTLHNFTPNQALSFEIPKSEKYKNVFLSTKEADGSNFFYFTIDPENFTRPKKMPSTLCLLWDVSGSGKLRNVTKELEILDTYFKKLGKAQIKLVTFSNEIHLEKDFEINSGNWQALKSSLEAQQFDGATQLGAIDLNKYNVEEVLFCSDGLSTFGEAEIKLSKAPIFSISSSQSADYSMLKYISQTSGGSFINLLKDTKEQAIKTLSTQAYHFINASSKIGEVTQLYPSIPTDVKKTFAMSGKMKGLESEVILNFGFGNEIVYTTSVKIKKETTTKVNFVKRIWAEKKINELDLRYEKNKGDITELGKANSIVTRNTSLIVLDRLEDYIANEIVPPTVEWQKQYYSAIKQKQMNTIVEEKEHLTDVITIFNERSKWWDKNYKYKKYSGTGEHNKFGLTYSFSNITAVSDSVTFASNNYSTSASLNESGTNVVNSNLNQSNRESEIGYTIERTKDEPIITKQEAEINLKNWDPKTPYMNKLKKAPLQNMYATYLEIRETYKDQPAFFLDAGTYFIKKGDKKNGLRILSNLAEVVSEDHKTLRVLAHKLQQLGYVDLAITTFREVLNLREEEPQSYRDLGLALAEKKRYQEAVDMLCKVVNKSWDNRFPEIEVLTAVEINNLITLSGNKVDLHSLDKRLIKEMPVDIRIVINWDSDNCDMDLWVTDPEKEVCMYDHNLTLNGGRISKDFTGGYGPEEFVVKKALNGKYLIQVNYFGTREQTLFGPTTVQAELYTNYGKPNQKKREITLRLKENKEVIDIGTLAFTN